MLDEKVQIMNPTDNNKVIGSKLKKLHFLSRLGKNVRVN